MGRSYENTWPFARNFLCRRFVKGLPISQGVKLTSIQEDPHLRRFQMFLIAARFQNELDFSYSGPGCTLSQSLVCTESKYKSSLFPGAINLLLKLWLSVLCKLELRGFIANVHYAVSKVLIFSD